MHKIIK